MPVRRKGTRSREVELLVGTRKGGFILRSDPRRKTWRIEGPFFTSWEVNHLVRDARSGNSWELLHAHLPAVYSLEACGV